MVRPSVVLPILTLLVGLTVGGAVGFLLGAPTDGDAGAVPVAGSSAGGAESRPQEDAEPAVESRSRAAAERRPETPARASVETRPAAGAGRITGSVRDGDGAPLAGVLVRAASLDDEEEEEDGPLDEGPPGAAPPRADLEREIAEYAAQRNRQEARVREATSDASGAYVLSGLDSETYTIGAWRAGYRIEAATEDHRSAVTVGSACDFRATPIRTVAVSVLLPDGRPAASASVTAKQESSTRSTNWTPARSAMELGPGTWELAATSDDPAAEVAGSGGPPHLRWGRRWHRWRDGDHEPLYRSEPQTVTVGADGVAAVTLRLVAQPGIRVRVAFANAERPRDVRVAALALDGTTPADPALLLGDDGVRSTWIEAGESGVLRGLQPGSYLVGATLRGGRVLASASVSVGSDVAEVELRAPDEPIRDWVTVWVRAPDGTPVRDVELECGCRAPGGSGDAQVDAVPQPDGSFRVEHYEPDAPSRGGGSSSSGSAPGGGQGTYFVRAESDRWSGAEATYDPAADREVTIRFLDPALLSVTVSGYAQSPDRDRIVLSVEPRGEDAEMQQEDRQAEIGSDGVAKFPAVRPGEYEVVLRLAASGSMHDRMMSWHLVEVSRTPARLGPGETKLTVALVPLTNLSVAWEKECPGIEQVHADGTATRLHRDPETTGRRLSTFRDLAAGRYRLLTGEGDMWVDVPSGGTVTFRPRPFDCYLVHVRGSGYLQELGLRSGDLVIAIDGVECRNGLELAAAIAAAKTRETAKFTVLRGGQRFDVVADGRRFEEDEGSFYRPWVR